MAQTFHVTSSGAWKAAKATEANGVFRYATELARSSMSRCRKCSNRILRGEIRVGIPIRHSAGEFGYISGWQHLKCTRIEERDGVEAMLFGFMELTEEQQALVLVELLSEERPAHLQELNPEDLVKRGKLPEATPPQALLRSLLPFQREGLFWMLQQERSEMEGGILADEMGMGKTIQTISLLLANRVNGPTLVVCPVSSMMQWEEEVKLHVVEGTLDVLVVYRTTKITLEALEAADIVLTTYPMLEQSWRKIVNESKVPCQYCGQLFLPRKLHVHNQYFCGPRAKRTRAQSKREVRRNVQSKATIAKGLRTLHVEIDEQLEEVKRVARNEKGLLAVPGEEEGPFPPPTTVTGPVAMYQELMREAGRRVMSRWDKSRQRGQRSDSSSDSTVTEVASDSSSDTSESDGEDSEGASNSEAERYERIALEYRCEDCGFQKLRYPFCPRTGHHHVLTEAQRLNNEQDHGADQLNVSKSIFHAVRWARIVLDEAHRIKGRTTSTARSAFALSAQHRWCLTGTPLQNRVGDVYSLLRFLRFQPYSQYYCNAEGCSCTSISHPFSAASQRHCIFCGHGPLQHFSYFNRHILNPITRYGYVGDGRQGMMLLTNNVLSRLMLRRTKVERSEELSLPPCTIKVVEVTQTPEERSFYESLYKKSTTEFDTFISRGTVLHNYAHIFQLLARLRQALDHPLLVLSNMAVGTVHHEHGMCALCQEGLSSGSSMSVDPCHHMFHRVCLSQYLESLPSHQFQCPMCFVAISVDFRRLHHNWGVDDEDDKASVPASDEGKEGAAEEPEAGGPPVTRGTGGKKNARSGKGKGKDSKVPLKPMKATKLEEKEGEEDVVFHHETSDDREEEGERERENEACRGAALPPEWEEAVAMQASAVPDDGEAQAPSPAASPRAAKGASNGAVPPSKRPPILSRLDPKKPLMGTKLDAIADYICNIPTTEKAIVFSQFGAMLDLTGYWIQRRQIRCSKLTGSMTLTQRQAVLHAFLHDPTLQVILISLKAGGEGLNLQHANHVILVDPWWNPAVEMQAVQRAHRIGQTRPVTAVRFVTKNTVEERMMGLQAKKMLVFEGTIDGKMTALQQLSEEDLQFLFNA